MRWAQQRPVHPRASPTRRREKVVACGACGVLCITPASRVHTLALARRVELLAATSSNRHVRPAQVAPSFFGMTLKP